MEIIPWIKVQKIVFVNLNNVSQYSSDTGELNKALLDEYKVVDKQHITWPNTFDKGLMCFTLEKSIQPQPK